MTGARPLALKRDGYRARAVRTLVISDLHLGNRGRRDVLRRPEALERLLAALDGVDRLVLLGDTLEYHGRHADQALAEAEPVLSAIGARMAGREIVFVPGNHDHPLIRRWARGRGEALGLADEVPAEASPGLTRVLEALAPARVRASYPGVWLDDDVYALHGHYADRHLRPESAVGVLRREPARAMRPADYERRRTRRRARPSASRAGRALIGARQRIRSTILFRLVPFVLRPPLAPLIARVLDVQMRRSALPAQARVLANLGVEARWVLFGHVHRLGPGERDDPAVWAVAPGGGALLNTGSWLYERLLAQGRRPPHPYWPGGAIVLDAGQPPAAVGILDALGRDALAPAIAPAFAAAPAGAAR